MKKSKARNRGKIVATGATIALLASSAIAYKVITHQTSYTVTRVIDGDTFETAEK